MSDTPRLANIGKYMRDRYTDDLRGQKRAMVEAQLKRASREDLEKVAVWPLIVGSGLGLGAAAYMGNKALGNPAGKAWQGVKNLGSRAVSSVQDMFKDKPKPLTEAQQQTVKRLGLGKVTDPAGLSRKQKDALDKPPGGVGPAMRQAGKSGISSPVAGGARAGQRKNTPGTLNR